jgi:hypothetical protein
VGIERRDLITDLSWGDNLIWRLHHSPDKRDILVQPLNHASPRVALAGGRTSVHEFILRYGEWAVFIDPTETFAQVLHHFQQFDQATFDQESARFLTAQRRLQGLYRFRHHLSQSGSA